MNKRKKVLAIIIVSVIAISVFFTGTFAWQSISQLALNEVAGNPNPGGRLHDDFNGRDKKVYVENFTDENDGTAIYARVRLKEYMEIGQGAGSKRDDITVTKIGKTTADVKKTETWITHKHSYQTDDNDPENLGHYEFHDYWKWTLGGKTAYLPTFNKNKYSLEADINGTFAGPDNNPETDEDRYADYKEYTLGEEISGTSKYDADDNSVDEGEEAKVGVNYIEKEEKHIVKETLDAKVVTMEQWKVLGCPIGDYWVYDVDGWAYWAKPINPGEATGLLLSGIELVREPNDEWYYAINAEGQFATAGDWGKNSEVEGDRTGFYKDGFTDDALLLLNKVSNLLPRVDYIKIDGGAILFTKAGEPLELGAKVYLNNASGKADETKVIWSSEVVGEALRENIFTATDNMVGKSYKITATSFYDKSITSTVDIIVCPKESKGVVNGVDGNKYVDFGDNTYKKVLENGTLDEKFISAGLDQKIGNADDDFNVVVLDKINATYGDKFLGPYYEDNIYFAKGADGLLGTSDDIRVVGDPWPNNIHERIADGIKINGIVDVKKGKSYNFYSEVTSNGIPLKNQDAEWSIVGSVKSGTKINSEGVLTIDTNETIGYSFKIKAESKMMKGLNTELLVTVKDYGYDDIPDITPGSLTTVNIDGADWYVLAKKDNKALIFSKDASFKYQATGTNWETSGIRKYLNSTWLDGKTELKNLVVESEIYTKAVIDSSVVREETLDKVFLLSEADVSKTTGQPLDYTYGGSRLIVSGMSTENTFLRDYSKSGSGTASFKFYSGDVVWGSMPGTQNIRPAMWVKLPEINKSQVSEP